MALVRTEHGDEVRERVLQFLREYRKEHGIMPQVTEISKAVGISRTSVYWHLDHLKETGMVQFDDSMRARTLRLTTKARR